MVYLNEILRPYLDISEIAEVLNLFIEVFITGRELIVVYKGLR